MLENGLADLAIYGVENSCDNRILLADYLPENIDEEEVQADAILLQKWQEHIKYIEDETPDGTPIVEMMLEEKDHVMIDNRNEEEGEDENEDIDEDEEEDFAAKEAIG